MPVKSLKGGIGVRPLGFGLGAAEEETDAEFNQTVLLLHGDGSEGAGNTAALGSPNYKAFKDNSTSAHALAVAGDAYGNDFSPFYYADGYWSILFDHNNDDKVVVGDTQTACGFGSSADFQIDCMIYSTRPSSDSQGFFGTQGTNTDSTGWRLQYDGSNIDWNHGTSNIHTFAFTFTPNTWFHFVIQRVSGTFKIFIDGVEKISTSDTTNYGATTNLTLGNGGNTGAGEMSGYLSNLRVITGASSTTSKITSPLSSNSDTLCLVAQSNRFVDNSSNNKTLTATNAPKVSTNTPFTQSKTANVGSGFFDGNTDNLTTTGSSDFAFGTGDFTVEAWVYPLALGGIQVALDLRYSNNSNTDNISAIFFNGTKLACFIGANKESGTDIPVGDFSWQHVVIQRISGTLYFAVNGKVSSTTVSSSDNLNNTSQRATIGGNVDQTTVSMYQGYIADMRVVNGTGVYGTSDFDVPTTSLTAVTNTKLLTCQYSGAVRNVGFVDNSKYNHRVVRLGDATMGTFSPFSLEDGYWSVYFDGSGDELNLTNTATIGTGNFTMEMWIFPFNRSNSCLIDSRSSNGATDGIIFKLNGNKFQISGNNGTTDIPLGEWTHLAVVREGTGTNETKMYINGALEKTITFNLNLTSTFFGVGVFNDGSNSGPYRGYISNLRVVNDTVYTGAFTVSSTPLTAIANTDVLICQSHRFIDNSTNGFAITLPQGEAKVLPFSPFAPTRSYSKDAVGGSLFVDGDTDVVYAIESGSNFTYGTGDYEFSCWLYRTVGSTQQTLFGRDSTGNTTVPYIYITSGNKFSVYYTSNILSSSVDVPVNAWCHLVASRVSGTLKLFQDGVQVGSVSDTTDLTASGKIAVGGQWTGNTNMTTGYITDARVRKGTGVTSVTVPTAPISADTNTALLLNFTNAGIIDHTMRNNLETEDNTRISGQQVKFGTGSIYFDGTSDIVVVSNSNSADSFFSPKDGDFTWEMFVNFSVLSGGSLYTLFSKYGSASEYQFYYNAGNHWNLSHGATTKSWADTSIATDTWYHIALVKDGTDYELFKDGTSLGTNAFSNPTAGTRPFVLGSTFNGSDSALYLLNGYLDEVRVTTVARYTSNFTAPTKAFANR